MKKTLLSWSSGKDSAWTLHQLRQDPAIELVGLFTVINKKYSRASMHATSLPMLQAQADRIGLPLETIPLPDPCTMDDCNAVMRRFVEDAATRGVECMAFGDLYLADIRAYREEQLKGTGIEPLFPLWQVPTADLAQAMLAAGLQAYISSVDLKKLPLSFAGQPWSADLLATLPPGCDPCGENGEIHTVVVAGPMFHAPIPVRVGEILQRDGFAYADIIPTDAGSAPHP